MKCKCCGYTETVPNDGKWRLCPKCQTINDNAHVCPICDGDGTKECDVETTTGTVKQYDGPCDKCGGTGLVKPSASDRLPNEKGELPRPGNEGGAHGKDTNGK